MRVDLGRGEALVAEQLLDDAEIGPTLEQVGRERMAEGVWRDADRETRPLPQQVEPVAQATNAERLAPMVQEDLGRAGVGAAAARRGGASAGSEWGPAVVEVRPQRRPGGSPEQADPLLATLAQHPDLATPQVERAEVGRRQLADAEPGRVGRLDDR